MKTLLTLFVLLFSSSVVADDISDLDIGGIRIGDSMLDYMTQQEILDHMGKFVGYGAFSDDKYLKVPLFGNYNLEIQKNFDFVEIIFENHDRKFIVEGIFATIAFEDIQTCLNRQEEFANGISYMFPNVKKIEKDNIHESGKYYVHYSFDTWFRKSGNTFTYCYEDNSFLVSIYSAKLQKWLKSLDLD